VQLITLNHSRRFTAIRVLVWAKGATTVYVAISVKFLVQMRCRRCRRQQDLHFFIPANQHWCWSVSSASKLFDKLKTKVSILQQFSSRAYIGSCPVSWLTEVNARVCDQWFYCVYVTRLQK